MNTRAKIIQMPNVFYLDGIWHVNGGYFDMSGIQNSVFLNNNLIAGWSLEELYAMSFLERHSRLRLDSESFICYTS